MIHTHSIQLPQDIDEVLPSKATGCLATDKQILNANGHRIRINNVKVGDSVIGTDGRFAYVTGLYYEKLRAFKLTPIGSGRDEAYTVNAEHLLPVIHKKEGVKKLISVWDWYNMTPKERAGWRMYKAGAPYFRGSIENLNAYRRGWELGTNKVIETPGIGFTTLPSLIPYTVSTIENRLQFLAGLMDTNGLRTPSGYKYDTYYDPLADAILSICWSLGMEAKDTPYNISKARVNAPDVYIHHLRITEGSLRIPSKRYQVDSEVPENAEDRIPDCYNLYQFVIEDTGEYADFYGIRTDRSGYYLLEDFTCAYHCEPVDEEDESTEDENNPSEESGEIEEETGAEE